MIEYYLKFIFLSTSCFIWGCSINETTIFVKLPTTIKISELCDYYSWARFYSNDSLIIRDSSLSNVFAIPKYADSAEIYINGFGYTIIDTAFRLPIRSKSIKINEEAYPYFTAHAEVDEDYKNGELTVYVEDYEYFLIDSLYNWLSNFHAKAEYYSSEHPKRNERFVYNCYATKYFYKLDSNFTLNTFYLVDSLTYIELDNRCKIASNEIDFPILNRLSRLNYNLSTNLDEALSKRYNKSLISEYEKSNIELEQIISLITTKTDYRGIRIAEMYGYKNPYKFIGALIPMLKDTSFVGLTNSADLIIYDRLNSGDLRFYGHGGVVRDDLFTVTGRANHLLSKITGSILGQVRMHPRIHYLDKLECRWMTYYSLLERK